MKKSLILLVFCILIPILLHTQLPNTISYQGVLQSADGILIEDGNYEINFTLFNDAINGDELWSESQNVDIRNGLFAVQLGSVESLNLSFDQSYWLEVSVNGSTLSPRTALTASPYSLGGRATEVSASSLATFDDGIVIHSQDTAIYFVPIEGGMYIGPDANPNIDSEQTELNRAAKVPQVINVKRLFARDNNNTPIVSLSTEKDAISGTSLTGIGAQGISDSNAGLWGESQSSYGVFASSQSGTAVQAQSASGTAVFGSSNQSYGVWGSAETTAGVYGLSTEGYGVEGLAFLNHGVLGESYSADYSGVRGYNNNGGVGVSGYSNTERGVSGISDSSHGVQGESLSGFGVAGLSDSNIGIFGRGPVAAGYFEGDVIIETDGRLHIDNVPEENTINMLVWGSDKFVKRRSLNDLIDGVAFEGLLQGHDLMVQNSNNDNVLLIEVEKGLADLKADLCAREIKAEGLCVYNYLQVKDDDDNLIFDLDPNRDPFGDYAFVLNGNVMVNGILITAKKKSPVVEEEIRHYGLSSDQVKNSYDGNVILDKNGEAIVQLPEWFEAFNSEFRYQLTCIGAYANVYVAEEVSDNHFKIAGGQPGMKVSWQITGLDIENK